MRRMIKLVSFVTLILVVAGGISVWQRLTVQPERLFERALADLDAGNFQAVEQAIETLLSQPDFERERRLLLAGLLVRQGDSSTALKELESFTPEGKLAALYYQFSGEALYREHDLTAALYCMSQLLKLEPENPAAHRWLAAIYYDLGALSLAMDHLDRLVELAPEDYRPHRLKAVIHSDFEQYQLAVDDYRRALERDVPAELRASLRLQLAGSLLKLDRFQDVLDLFSVVEPDAEIWLARAKAWRGLGEQARFREALQQAQSLAADDIEVVKLTGYAHLDRGELEAAREEFATIVEQEPFDVEALYQLALIERQLGHDGVYEELMHRKEASQKLYEEMTDLSRKILTDPLDAGSRDRLAEICTQLGKEKMAEVWRRAAAESRALKARQPQPEMSPEPAAADPA